MKIRSSCLVAVALAVVAACGATSPSPPDAPPPGTFAFGVFGDGPYRIWEEGRFRRVIEDVNGTDLQWLIHVGDILWYPCSDAAFQRRLRSMNSMRHPVIYIPGDNEWTDCHEPIAGGYEPLERLASLRRIFFSNPHRSLGGRLLELESQADSSAFAEFVENRRWAFGGLVFATVHLVGSDNALEPFKGRTQRSDDEVARRTQADIQWMDDTFAMAQKSSANGVVLAFHADAGLERAPGTQRGFEPFLAALARNVAAFPGQVLLIHGDSHEERFDHPFRDETGKIYENVSRLETFGSPDIGWVRVVMDTSSGRITQVEPRLMRGGW